MEGSFYGVVGDISTGSLLTEPFANVTLRCAGGRGELGGRLRSAFCECFIEAQPVSDANQCGVKSGAKINNGLAQKFMEFILIDAHWMLLGGCSVGRIWVHSRSLLRNGQVKIFSSSGWGENSGGSLARHRTPWGSGGRIFQAWFFALAHNVRRRCRRTIHEFPATA